MQQNQSATTTAPKNQQANEAGSENNDHPHAVIFPEDKLETFTPEETIKEEVKESFQDEDIPVEPVLGDDGIEVGGQG